jgi:two-component system KDP operon response regulator KdpE
VTLKILVVDDEPQIRKQLKIGLNGYGYEVLTAAGGQEALVLAAQQSPDMLILDISLGSEPDGTEVCRRLREWSKIPVIILSVHSEEKTKVVALNAGADDYLTKPFGMEELLARIRVALRHLAQSQGSGEPVIQAGHLLIDLARHIVKRDGEEIRLTPTEYDLLAYLALNARRVLTHSMILEHVWGSADMDNTEYLRVYMMQLRKKLEEDPHNPKYLMTEPGVGYRFALPD